MNKFDIKLNHKSDKILELNIEGYISYKNAQETLVRIKQIIKENMLSEAIFNLAKLEYLDISGVALFFNIEKYCNSLNIKFKMISISEEIKGLFNLFDKNKLINHCKQTFQKQNFFTQIGEIAFNFLKDIKYALTFIGDIVIGIWKAIKSPFKIRWQDTFFYMERVGVDALPIVILINFLIGLIMAFQGAIQLRQFGANIYVADLVGLATVRELAPLMTALIIAGRSGSAFAAEIGTMKVSEEVDAMATMGFDPIRFLVMPKMISVFIMMPCLVLFADLVGIIGGGIIGVTALDLSVVQFVNQTYKALSVSDILCGLSKSVIFAILISGVGCMRGFQVRGGAESVGRYTTSAVVSGIFLIILSDAIYTIVAHFFPSF